MTRTDLAPNPVIATDRLFAPHVAQLAGYVPGEQPREGGITKLNTNENPYPPSPRVLEAIRSGLNDCLRLYPDPVGTAFRRAAGELHGVEPDMVLVGNGSDDLLTILTRSFVGVGATLTYPSPSYILYRTLAEIQGANWAEVAFEPDWSIYPGAFAASRPRLVFVANPNSPSGTVLDHATLAGIAEAVDCPVVVDEAYVNFAESDAVALLQTHPNVIILRTLSKGYSLAGLRVGYLLAQPEIVAGLVKVKDSYNADALSLLGGEAALRDQDHLRANTARIVATRARLTDALRLRGYHVPASHANFVWATGGPAPAAATYEALKARQILVRLMRYAGIEDGLRVTVGTDAAVDHFLATLDTVI